MSEKSHHSHVEQTSRERAWAMAEVAHGVGDIAINVIKNEGESFTRRDMKGRNSVGLLNPRYGNNAPSPDVPQTVKEGNVLIQVNGEFPNGNTGEFNNQVRERVEEQAQAAQQAAPENVPEKVA